MLRRMITQRINQDIRAAAEWLLIRGIVLPASSAGWRMNGGVTAASSPAMRASTAQIPSQAARSAVVRVNASINAYLCRGNRDDAHNYIYLFCYGSPFGEEK